ECCRGAGRSSWHRPAKPQTVTMKVKVQCSCETRYAFEVEPVNGRMPVRVNCPSCGADGTHAANAIIQQQLAASSPPAPNPVPVTPELKPRVRIGGSAPSPAPAAPSPPPAPVAAVAD